MRVGEDGMIAKTKCAITKSRLTKRTEANVKVCECTIHTSVIAGTFLIDIPEKDMKICIQTQDLLSVLNASNQKYMELRQKEINMPLVKE